MLVVLALSLIFYQTRLIDARLLMGVIVGFGSALFGGLAPDQIDTAARPNQGIRLSARNAILIGLMGGISIGFGGLTFGGYACLSHLALRLVLWRQGVIPWNYVAFLDYAASWVFLRKVGGGYIFVHRMLLEYFAALPDAQAIAVPSAAPAPQAAAEGTAIK